MKLSIYYAPNENHGGVRILPDGMIEEDVKKIIDSYHFAKTRNLSFQKYYIEYVGNELYIYFFRLAIKNGLLNHEDLEVIFLTRERFINYKHVIIFNKNGNFINSSDYPKTTYDRVIQELL